MVVVHSVVAAVLDMVKRERINLTGWSSIPKTPRTVVGPWEVYLSLSAGVLGLSNASPQHRHGGCRDMLPHFAARELHPRSYKRFATETEWKSGSGSGVVNIDHLSSSLEEGVSVMRPRRHSTTSNRARFQA
ncbi:hypothetical protein PAAG_03786 [Paracoccidioides lutzii Pb01]|uniref:Uncharacterized protein n=1 Tax=Paracoccidioides lutzii (strain ATCC MYA-826 / Pb01) TaxID=502779 RepID=C1GZ42_PARBA|nr:hypothetical protein PAAG_03786 [Paracoccidioides lutzii Pb01]EEH41865.2 hypothetical protein PAAG_03786 [Paracoccidioides lutzii Pb01]